VSEGVDLENRDRILLFFFILSLLLHVAFLYLLNVKIPLESEDREGLEVLLLNKKIADINPPERQERPDKADFLGLYDSRVDEEMVAKTLPRPSVPQGKKAPKQSKSRQESAYALDTPFFKYKENHTHAGDEGWQIEDNLPEDYYPNYRIGPSTYLNVHRYPQITYFVRLKKIFKTTFNPVPSLRQSFATNIISRGQVEVVLGVSVDRAGVLKNLFVINSSGLDLYDKEALRTVRDSSPFAAPPDNLLAPDGLLRMSWTFTVYL